MGEPKTSKNGLWFFRFTSFPKNIAIRPLNPHKEKMWKNSWTDKMFESIKREN